MFFGTSILRMIESFPPVRKDRWQGKGKFRKTHRKPLNKKTRKRLRKLSAMSRKKNRN